MRRLTRLLSTFVLALALFQAVGSRLPGLTIACVETCPDDDDQGTCPQICDCSCRAPHRVPLATPTKALLPPSDECNYAAGEVEAPPSPDPRALLHVPKALLA